MDAGLSHFDWPNPSGNRAARQVTVADHLAVALSVGQVAMGFDPISDLRFDRLGQHALSPVTKHRGQYVCWGL